MPKQTKLRIDELSGGRYPFSVTGPRERNPDPAKKGRRWRRFFATREEAQELFNRVGSPVVNSHPPALDFDEINKEWDGVSGIIDPDAYDDQMFESIEAEYKKLSGLKNRIEDRMGVLRGIALSRGLDFTLTDFGAPLTKEEFAAQLQISIRTLEHFTRDDIVLREQLLGERSVRYDLAKNLQHLRIHSFCLATHVSPILIHSKIKGPCLLTKADLADELGVPVRTVEGWQTEGKLAHRKLGERLVRYLNPTHPEIVRLEAHFARKPQVLTEHGMAAVI